MTELKKLYVELPLPNNSSSNSFSAAPISGYGNHRIAKNIYNQPSLLVYISDPIEDFDLINQNLYNIKVVHNIKCEIEIKGKLNIGYFTVITYIGGDDDVSDVFLIMCQTLLSSLGRAPSNKKIKDIVNKLIELFRAIKKPPSKTIQGLWSELFLISQSSNPEDYIRSWHSIPAEKFDFCFDSFRLEVKSTVSELRIHNFSIAQLNPVGGLEVIIASIRVGTTANGLSIYDLMNLINIKILNFPEIKEKLCSLVYTTLGFEVKRIKEIKYDYGLAKDSLRFYRAEDIPKIDIVHIPKELSDVRFSSNLLNSKVLEVGVDTLFDIAYTKGKDEA
ncbi:MAG: PD-(D/E)XK motif protein [Balneolia bacterium]|nr:PD-(D/E)XK motif protein [Balneolia bacterium]